MFLRIFGSQKPLTPLSAGEIVAIRFSFEPELSGNSLNPMTGEKIGAGPASGPAPGARVLYARVAKVSKKRNIFVRFVSKDKGENLAVGMDGILTALKPRKWIEFPTRLLHRDAETFIFSPPMAVETAKVSSIGPKTAFSLSLPLDYRAASSPYSQRGTLTGFSWERMEFTANLQIPAGTVLKFEFEIPYQEEPVRFKGKVESCRAVPEQSRKYKTCAALQEVSPPDRDALFHYFLLTKQPLKAG